MTMDQNKKCILVVDDTPSYIALLNMILQEHYAVKGVPKGEIALKLVRKAPESIDLIMLDIMMEGMDGFEVCKAVKQDERTSHIPIILLTAKSDLENKIEGLQTEADDYITKPFSRDELYARIYQNIDSLEIFNQVKEIFEYDIINILCCDNIARVHITEKSNFGLDIII